MRNSRRSSFSILINEAINFTKETAKRISSKPRKHCSDSSNLPGRTDHTGTMIYSGYTTASSGWYTCSASVCMGSTRALTQDEIQYMREKNDNERRFHGGNYRGRNK
jgi:hypothetical protein